MIASTDSACSFKQCHGRNGNTTSSSFKASPCRLRMHSFHPLRAAKREFNDRKIRGARSVRLWHCVCLRAPLLTPATRSLEQCRLRCSFLMRSESASMRLSRGKVGQLDPELLRQLGDRRFCVGGIKSWPDLLHHVSFRQNQQLHQHGHSIDAENIAHAVGCGRQQGPDDAQCSDLRST